MKTKNSESPQRATSENVKAWLKKEGFPFEMEVASALTARKFSVTQGDYYKDPLTDKGREIDLTAALTRSDASTSLTITLIVECKFARRKPWILLLPTQQYLMVNSLSLYNSAATKEAAAVLTNMTLIPGLTNPGVLQGPSVRAYSAVSAFRDSTSGPDEAYAGPISVARAMRALTGENPTTPFSIDALLEKNAGWRYGSLSLSSTVLCLLRASTSQSSLWPRHRRGVCFCVIQKLELKKRQ